jgi:hypothetical protein
MELIYDLFRIPTLAYVVLKGVVSENPVSSRSHDI